MLFTADQSLQNMAIQYMQRGPVNTTDLLRYLKEKRSNTTKQGMYKSLRQLLQKEVIIKHKKQIFLNIAWLEKVGSFVSIAEHFHKDINRTGGFLGLSDGEKIKYEFRDLASTDVFWNHVLYLLIEAHPNTLWLSYNPHCWFFLVRLQSEHTLKDFIEKNGGRYLLTVGGKTPLDRHIKSEFDNKIHQYYMRDSMLFSKSNYYVNVIGDFIVEALINPIQARDIENVYVNAKIFDTDIEEKLKKIITSVGKMRFIVTRDKKKANKLRRKLSKSFY